MLYTIQTFLEDYLNKRYIVDSDSYAVRFANTYFHHRSKMDTPEFLRKVREIKTVIFKNNEIKDRGEFEKILVERLDRRFKKKLGNGSSNNPISFRSLELEKENLQKQLLLKQRYLQKLKEQQSAFGLYTPPYILIEIEDTEEDIQFLKAELSKISC